MKQAFLILLIAMVCIGCESSIPSGNTTTKGIGVFSVSETKKVTFSPSNLYYDRETSSWNFFQEQWNALTITNLNSPVGINGRWFSTLADVAYPESIDTQVQLGKKIDLFGWSGSNSAVLYGVNASPNYKDYMGDFMDWGNNQIGKDAPNTWRTLSKEEFEYLIDGRPNAAQLKGVAAVNGVNGLILLPDEWECPAGVSFKSGFASSGGEQYFAKYQSYTASEWQKMERAGAAFLPAAGYKNGVPLLFVGSFGCYWTRSLNISNPESACFVYIYSDSIVWDYYDRYRGLSVRPVYQ